MTTKNTPRGMLLNGEVLNLSVKVIKDLLGLDSVPNADYSDEMVVYHLLNACTSQTSVNQVSNVCVDGPSEGDIRYRLRKLDLDEVQQALNDNLKLHTVKTVRSKSQVFAIDFVNIHYYGEEENKGDTIKTKPRQGTSRFYAYASIYLILRNKRYTLAVKYITKRRNFKRHHKLLNKRNRKHRI